MKTIFISHAGKDAAIANKLSEDLRNAGHDTKIDTHELTLGKDSIEFMNNAILESHVIIILHSKDTPKAVWQRKEINSAVWNEIQQDGGLCVVIRLDDTTLPPLLGPKLFATLTDSNYQETLENLCESIMTPKDKTASSIVAEAFKSESLNPFRRVRAEFFEDFPKLLADTFSPPEAMKVQTLEDMKPCFLEGSRGTGKSMLLLSLRGRNLASRRDATKGIKHIFGFYLKNTRGAFSNAGILSKQESDPLSITEGEMIQITDMFSQELIVSILESLFSELEFCIEQGHINCESYVQSAIVDKVIKLIHGDNDKPSVKTIKEFKEHLGHIHRDIGAYIRRKFIYLEDVSVPIATLDLVMFKRIIKILKEALACLSNSLFVVLMDEYENLFPFQQKVANGFVKFASPEFSIKIAKKMGSAETAATTTGQPLQELHDYNRIPLVYDVGDPVQLRAFCDIIEHITAKLTDNAGLRFEGIESLFPKHSDEEVDKEKWLQEIAKLLKISREDMDAMPEDKRREKITYYGEAAKYRALYGPQGRHRKKRYSGFEDLALISSGVIRYFQEIVGVGFQLQYGDKLDNAQPVCISPDNQTSAVHFVSEHYLTTLSRNVENDGERLKYYILDLGSCIRQKLLKHTSEPEAARITVVDAELLETDGYKELKRLLSIGVREGVLQTKEGRPGYKPKHTTDPQPTEFNISRIYAPVLQISPRLRWPTKVYCKELLALWDQNTRSDAMKKLMNRLLSINKGNVNQGGIEFE